MNGRKDQHEHGSQGRTEPTLGDLDRLDAPAPRAKEGDELPKFTLDPELRRGHSRARGDQRPRRRGWLIPLALLLAIGAGTALWLGQDRLRGLVPSTELDGVLGRAETALQDGHLDGNDGTSARELFEAARALQPDNDRARDGLRNVGLAEVSRADAALQAGKLDEAEQALATARELLGGGADVDRLTQALSGARNGSVQTEHLIEQAQQAFEAGKLDGEDGAGALYHRVLAADPGNAVAAHGLDKVGEALASQVHKALDAGDRATASALVDRIAALLPNFGELPALRAALVPVDQAGNGALAEALRQGEDALRAGRIAGTGDDTALAHYKAALAIDPDNADAKAGLGQVAQALIVQANAAVDGGNAAQARKLLDQAAELAPRSAELTAARARLGDTRRSPAAQVANDVVAESAQSGEAMQHPALTPQQGTELARTIQRAEVAARDGKLMLPPGESAYDLYRQALAVDGNNEAARRGLEGLPGVAMNQFNQSLASGNLAVAGNRLADLADLSPGNAGLGSLRQRLASAWMDQAEQQLQSGDRAGAAQSLDSARKLAPGNPRLAALTARLQAGS
ncbi:hypothetical protein ACXU4B_13385 [Dyella soli]|uniref:Tetratricopeptide repeat protein n=1 Tax=Dyella soli TaxID=522319 RepID=A0A4R0YFF8_9GAMM|nr:hypothetical protein [Dyella soli]TCI06873.1 hypothetical protein EZM97_30055 [Dyella soli]